MKGKFPELGRAWLLLLGGVVAGCGGEQSMLAPRGPAAGDIANIWWGMFWGGCAIFGLVMVLAFYVVFRNPDKRPNVRATPLILAGGLVLPLLTLTPLLFYGVKAGYRWSAPLEDAYRIEVIGNQFWWDVRYPNAGGQGAFAIANELRIPAGQPVELILRSRDVIHSFWVPSLAGKMDVFPDRVNRLRIQADEPGVFRGQCAEFCGLRHAHMVFQVIAQAPDEFEDWLAAQRQPARAPESELQKQGQRLFAAKCGHCHQVRDTAAGGSVNGAAQANERPGPDLTHIASRHRLGAGTITKIDAANLTAWLPHHRKTDVQVQMPDLSRLDEPSRRALAAYLAHLQ